MNAARILVIVAVALVGGLVGYQIGISQELAAEGGRVAYWPGFGFGFGWLLFLFLIFALVFAFRPRWGWGPGPRGRGGPGGYRSRWQEGFDEWHRRAHDEPADSRSDDRPQPS
jgi:hypothetical protein